MRLNSCGRSEQRVVFNAGLDQLIEKWGHVVVVEVNRADTITIGS